MFGSRLQLTLNWTKLFSNSVIQYVLNASEGKSSALCMKIDGSTQDKCVPNIHPFKSLGKQFHIKGRPMLHVSMQPWLSLSYSSIFFNDKMFCWCQVNKSSCSKSQGENWYLKYNKLQSEFLTFEKKIP